MDQQLVRLSKFLSLVLRHNPGAIGITLDPHGWVGIDDLLAAAQRHGKPLDRATLLRIVAENEKRRFALSDDGTHVRASQGHSVAVDLGLEPVAPPKLLYHGTATRFVDAIRREGLRPGSRQHVHLSADHATAVQVGRRHGKPFVLAVRAGAMAADGFAFFRSDNGVWLTEHVPARYLDDVESPQLGT